MGEIAEGLLNGDFDCITGEYLGEGDGYPRTMQKQRQLRVSYSEKTVNRILSDDRLPKPDSRIIQDGYQILFNGNKFTFFPKHCKMSFKGKWYIHNSGQEVEKMLELTGYYKKPSIPNLANNNGTQSCIDHINKKVEFMQSNGGKNDVIAMLKSIALELSQYL